MPPNQPRTVAEQRAAAELDAVQQDGATAPVADRPPMTRAELADAVMEGRLSPAESARIDPSLAPLIALAGISPEAAERRIDLTAYDFDPDGHAEHRDEGWGLRDELGVDPWDARAEDLTPEQFERVTQWRAEDTRRSAEQAAAADAAEEWRAARTWDEARFREEHDRDVAIRAGLEGPGIDDVDDDEDGLQL